MRTREQIFTRRSEGSYTRMYIHSTIPWPRILCPLGYREEFHDPRRQRRMDRRAKAGKKLTGPGGNPDPTVSYVLSVMSPQPVTREDGTTVWLEHANEYWTPSPLSSWVPVVAEEWKP